MPGISKKVRELQRQAVGECISKKVRGRPRLDGKIINGKVFTTKKRPQMAVDTPKKNGPKHYGSKERHRKTLLAYLSNPENDWPKTRGEYVGILGLSSCNKRYIYKIFYPEELFEIENEAMKLRRSYYLSRSAQVDDALYEQAKQGKAAEVKLFYQRFEGWNPKETPADEGSGAIANKLCDALLSVLKPVYMGEASVESSGEVKLLSED